MSIKIWTTSNYDFSRLEKIPAVKLRRGNNSGRSQTRYADLICAFDIETTRIEEIEQSVMYLWQFALGKEDCVIGRTWDDFKFFVDQLREHTPEKLRLCTYVHNLSYEFQFLRGVFDFQIEDVFAVERRKVLKANLENILELRCSYILTNMSLGQATQKYDVEHKKLKDFEYTEKRYPWTPLTDKEIQYGVNDVIGLVEVIEKMLELECDTLSTIPLTSTGYVRRDVKRNGRDFKLWLQDKLPDLELYKLLKAAFRGGDTHASRWFVGKVIEDVKSADRQSSYPDVMCNCPFPMGEFFHEKRASIEDIERLINVRGKAVVFEARLYNIRLRDKFTPSPYIALHKAKPATKTVIDNGRVLSADLVTLRLTDLDYKIVKHQYVWDRIEITDCYHTKYDMLPESLRSTIIDYYKKKTELKGVEGQEIFYMKSKNKLNSIYGMSATDILKRDILFTENEDGEKDFILDDSTPDSAILAASNKRAFILFQWGVWVTAWARYRLFEAINMCGDNFIYADTDSVKYVGEIDWTEYNNARIADSEKNGAYAFDKHGKKQYMGIMDDDGHYKLFRTWGAKKYAYVDTSGKLKITVAGVGKSTGAHELLAKSGDAETAIRNEFVPGTVFREAGGLEAIYNDSPEVKEIEIDGHTLPITSNVCLRPSTYTLGLTAEYLELLKLCTAELLELAKIVNNE